MDKCCVTPARFAFQAVCSASSRKKAAPKISLILQFLKSQFWTANLWMHFGRAAQLSNYLSWGEERINHLSPLNEFLIWACHWCRAVSITMAFTPPPLVSIIFWSWNNPNSCSEKEPLHCWMKRTEINVSSFNTVKYAVQGQINVAEPDRVIITQRLTAVLHPPVSARRIQRARSATGLSPLHTTVEPWALS